MKWKLPYSLLPAPILRKISHLFLGLTQFIGFLIPSLEISLTQANFKIKPKEYLSMCLLSSGIFFIFISSLVAIFLIPFDFDKKIGMVFVSALIFTLFVFMQQIYYPNIILNKRVKNIERNLLPALQNILVQLNSGVSLFDIFLNISEGEYGEISKEFGKTIKSMSAGTYQIEALEDLAATNPSIYFRKSIWQLVNGMKSGADLSGIMKEIIKSISEEQVIQIQKYGAALNPLAMFYMLAAVIIPSLGITFLIMLSSFIALSTTALKVIFWGMYIGVVIFQFLFIGIIKSKRPNLLG